MPITADPIDVDTIVVPDDLSSILKKDRATPTFNTVLAKHRKIVTPLRRQVWPVATSDEPTAEPEDVPDPHPGVEPEPADVPAPEPTNPETDPEG